MSYLNSDLLILRLLFYYYLLLFLFHLLAIYSSFLLECNCFTMLCQFLLYDNMNQSYVYLHTLSRVPLPYPNSTPLGGSSQSSKLSSLCYTVAAHQLRVSHMVVCICLCYSLNPSPPFLPPLCPKVCFLLLYLHSSIPLFPTCKQINQNHFSRLHIYTLIYNIHFSLSHLLYMTGSRFIHITTTDSISFLYMVE